MGIKEDGRQTFYDVRCEDQAADAIEAKALAFLRGREVYDGLELLLSRMPYVGDRLPGRNPPEFVIRTAEPSSPEVPVITAHYRVVEEADRVLIIKLRYQNA